MTPTPLACTFADEGRRLAAKALVSRLIFVSEGRVAHKPPTDAAGRCKIVERVRLGDV